MPVRSSKVKPAATVPSHTCVQPCSMSHIDTHLIVGIAIGFLCGIATYAYGISYGVRMSSEFRAIPVSAGIRTAVKSNPNSPVSFKAMPVFFSENGSGTLINDDQNVLKFIARSNDPLKQVSMKQFMIRFTKTQGVSLSNFRIRRGAVDMNLQDFDVTCVNCNGGANVDLKSGSLASQLTSGQIVVSFKGEESLNNKGTIYAIHATTLGAKSGQSVTMSWVPGTAGGSMVFGSLTNAVDYYGVSSTAIYHIDTTNPADGSPEYLGVFVWSDLSSASHSPKVGWNGGSSDWVNQLTTTSTISYSLSL